MNDTDREAAIRNLFRALPRKCPSRGFDAAVLRALGFAPAQPEPPQWLVRTGEISALAAAGWCAAGLFALIHVAGAQGVAELLLSPSRIAAAAKLACLKAAHFASYGPYALEFLKTLCRSAVPGTGALLELAAAAALAAVAIGALAPSGGYLKSNGGERCSLN